MQTKKRHHYIWQYYLKSWTDQKNQVCCYFLQENKYESRNTSSIGVSKYFYRSHKLTNDDLKYIESIIGKASSPHQQNINQNWLDFLQQYYLLNDQIKASISSNQLKKIRDLEQLINRFEKMLFEELHTSIEDSAKEILSDLRDGNKVNWTDENTINFLFFMMNQFMRTRRQKVIYMNSIAGDEDRRLKFLPNWCPDRTWNIQAIILATNIGFSIYRDIENYSFDVLENNTPAPFITGDQPILNLGNPITEQDLWMYYPLSPNRCLILQPKDNRKYSSLDLKDINFLNAKIYNEAFEQVYSHDEVCLKKIIDNV